MEGLRQRIEGGEIDTVVLAFTDMQGRLQGKRLHGRYFLDHVVGHGTEGCNYLLVIYDDTYEDAARKGWTDLTPANQYNIDYSILGTTRVEPLLRDIRNHMYAAGLDVEGAKGECNFGQH